ncbi:MAG: hypothetical protein IH600_09995 [Bacteroidetes bacterium]|nr:hypothetical protein [Bacteroidota bacterium]
MAYRHLLGIIVVAAGLAFPLHAEAQELADSLVVTVTDSNELRNALVLGHHAEATPDFDFPLRESPVPPVPIDQVFDVRFFDPPGYPRKPSTGAYRDIRGITTADVDTFVVHCQPMNDGYPMRVKWNPALAYVQYSEAEIRTADGSKLVCDMRSTHEIMLEGREQSRFLIIIRR